MSGLVSGLQNRVRRFESARYLKDESIGAHLFCISAFSAHLKKLGGYLFKDQKSIKHILVFLK